MVGRDGEAPSTADERIDFIRELTLKSLRVKPDKWDRMYISDEQRHFIHSFVEGNKPIVNKLEIYFGVFPLIVSRYVFLNDESGCFFLFRNW